MSKILTVVAVVGFAASSASAIQLSLTTNRQTDGDEIVVGLSQTGVISIFLEIGAADGNVSFVDLFFDATPLNNGDAVGYDVMGNEFGAQRNDGTGWFRNDGDSSSRNIEDYSLIAADDEDGGGPGANGPYNMFVDNIIIHGTEIGSYDLYFENEFTSDGNPRPPRLRDSNGIELSDVFFRNAWRDDRENFDVPFRVIVVPEPSTMVLMAVAALGIIRRRRRDGEDTTCGRKHWSRSRVCAR